jgi:NADPH:quinone reductase-like Zn-dependent oxidoreductase
VRAFALDRPDAPAHLIDLPQPTAGEGEVLVGVIAASVNGFDIFEAGGALLGMMEHELPTVIGRDFAGVIDGVGPGVTEFAEEDAVFGFIPSAPPLKNGSFAEYIAGGAELVIVPKPAGLDDDIAAALPLAGSAALDILEAVEGHDGDVVLVAGATGGVGSLVVQLATRRGLRVIATARPVDEAFVRGLGAAETVDWEAGGVAETVRARHPDGIAALIDVVDRAEALADLAALVRTGGHVASLLGAVDIEGLAARSVAGHNVIAAPTPDKLRHLGDLVNSGRLRVPIQAVYPLERANEALEAFQRGTRGKLIVRP